MQSPPAALPEIRNASHDCVAFCSPGGVLSAPLLIERIRLFPRPNPKEVSEVCLQTEEVYDILIRAESEPISGLLILSPHRLFEARDPEATLQERVTCPPMLGGALPDNWQYAFPPRFRPSDGRIEVYYHNLLDQPGGHVIKKMDGTVGEASVSFPQELKGKSALVVLLALNITAVAITLDRPVELGENRWVRICIKPYKIEGPVPCRSEADPTVYSQMLDLLGPSTLLNSVRDKLTNLISFYETDRDSPADRRMEFITGCTVLFNYIFANGFEKPGSYTRIEEQRIILAPSQCSIRPNVHDDGCIRFKAMRAIDLNRDVAVAYFWIGGADDFPEFDPINGARVLLDFLKKFASVEKDAKSKTELAVANDLDYELCCRLVDVMTARGVLSVSGGESYYVTSSASLPKDAAGFWRILVGIASQLSESYTPMQARFRVFYEATWKQLTAAQIEQQGRQKRSDKWMKRRSVIALIIGLIGLALGIVNFVRQFKTN